MDSTTRSSRLFISYLMLTAVTSGALVMVIQVLGSRVIGPFFGVSLYVWTSLITVTLIALSVGYALGGVYADRSKNADPLFIIILLSGVAVLIIPFIKGMVLEATMPLGLRGGAFTSTLIIFGPALFLLGCVSPFIIKMAASELKNIGRTVGGFYALSTFGSVIGTFLTGFFLIAYLGVDKIFWATGLLLLLLSCGYFIIFKKKWVVATSLILPMLIMPNERTLSLQSADGTQIERVYMKDSFYGKLDVVDYIHSDKHIRELMIDGLIQGGIDMTNMMSINRYHYFLQFIPVLLNPDGKRSLVIGLGAGLIPRWYEKQGITTDVVDIDPLIFNIAKNYFDFKISGDAIVSDARYYLSNTQQRYDYLILDVFSGDLTPGHLVSREAFELISQRLNEKGILAMNLIGSAKNNSYMTTSIIKTLKAVFEHVEVYPTFDTNAGLEDNDGVGNFAVVAYQGDKLHFNIKNIDATKIHPRLQDVVLENIGKQYKFNENQPAIVLTDNYNPIDFYDVALRERIRKNLLQYLKRELLI